MLLRKFTKKILEKFTQEKVDESWEYLEKHFKKTSWDPRHVMTPEQMCKVRGHLWKYRRINENEEKARCDRCGKEQII